MLYKVVLAYIHFLSIPLEYYHIVYQQLLFLEEIQMGLSFCSAYISGRRIPLPGR